MKTYAYIPLALSFLATPAFAETKTLKLNAEQVVTLINGLGALDGYDKVIKDGAAEKTAHENYKLGGGLRLVIARNLAALKIPYASTQAARQKLINDANANGPIDKDPAKAAALTKELMEVLTATDDVPLSTIKSGELKLDENPIPGSVLSMISFILED